MAKLKARIGDTEMDEVDAVSLLHRRMAIPSSAYEPSGGAIPAPSSINTDEPPGEQASQPPEEGHTAEGAASQPTQAALQPYGVKLPHTLAAVWQMYMHEIKPRDAALMMDAKQALYDGAPPRRKALSRLRVIAEEIENRTRVLGYEAAIHSLEKVRLPSVNALANHLCEYQFRCKEPGTPSWKKALTLCPAAYPTLHALTSQIAEGAFDLAASEGFCCWQPKKRQCRTRGWLHA